MYARVITAQIKPSKIDEFAAIYRDVVVPAAKELGGSKGIFLLTDEVLGKFISISLWETEEELRAHERSGYVRARLAEVVETLASPIVLETYEVSAQET